MTQAAELLGLTLPDAAPMIVGVVGSKGKGTAAAYASATMSAAGIRTVTVTSPGFRSNRERIRSDGRSIEPSEYESLLSRLSDALARPGASADRYLSPSGAFMLLGALYAVECRAECLVIEAGMGGRSDDLSCFAAPVIAVTPIFGEHIGVLGDTIHDIAVEKFGVAKSGATVVSTQQRKEVVAAVKGMPDVRFLTDATTQILPAALPPGLGRPNALVGISAALEHLRLKGRSLPRIEDLESILETIRLPGRLTSVPDRSMLIDASINRAGAVAALTHFKMVFGAAPGCVVLSVPDGKDLEGMLQELASYDVRVAVPSQSHLNFAALSRSGLPFLPIGEISSFSAPSGVLVLGTIGFIGEVLDELDIDCDVTYQSPREAMLRSTSR
jgi:folylpolyglutamate synthase/dihydropteroate synthase